MENNVKKEIKEIAVQLEKKYKEQEIFDVALGEKIPNKAHIISIVDELRRVTFPGFFGTENLGYVSLENFAGNTIAMIYEKLYKQVKTALLYGKEADTIENVEQETEDICVQFINEVPDIQEMIVKDVDAALDGDPAANSKEDVIFSYPGLYAIFVYRYAHVLYELDVPFIPRIMTEYAHSQTGIDINPGAKIGEYFFIDHGTGIVIGETTEIGNNVKIYQGVTLGALSTRQGQALAHVKRHPTIEDNVVIYANTTILGGETVVGKNSVVAGNSFVTYSIPENTKVASTIPELKLKRKRE